MTRWPDVVNGCFELLGSVGVWRNVVLLSRHRQARGISGATVALFAAWGAWNLFYYPHLGQWWSFAGGVSIALGNAAWLAVLWTIRS